MISFYCTVFFLVPHSLLLGMINWAFLQKVSQTGFTIKFIMTSVLTLSFSFTEKGLDHVAENVLSYLDADSLYSAELVCKEWNRVISEGMLWKKLIERKVRTDSIWRGLAERRGW